MCYDVCFTSVELRVQFEREVYSVREDAQEVIVKIIASSTASFDYEVDITLSDINAICKLWIAFLEIKQSRKSLYICFLGQHVTVHNTIMYIHMFMHSINAWLLSMCNSQM